MNVNRMSTGREEESKATSPVNPHAENQNTRSVSAPPTH